MDIRPRLSKPITLSWPPEGERARRVITRHPVRIVTKHPSSRLRRMVHAESRLEVLAATVLDCHPSVHWYCEQPLTVHYQEADGRDRWHIPDFLAFAGERRVLWEIKRAGDPRLVAARERMALLQGPLQELGIEYRIVTDLELNVQPALDTIRVLNRMACVQLDVVRWERIRRWLDEVKSVRWDEVTGLCEDRELPCLVARAILEGRLHIDLSVPLRARESTIYLHATDRTGLEGPWQSLL
jgi:TnsA endonuclease N terminal